MKKLKIILIAVIMTLGMLFTGCMSSSPMDGHEKDFESYYRLDPNAFDEESWSIIKEEANKYYDKYDFNISKVDSEYYDMLYSTLELDHVNNATIEEVISDINMIESINPDKNQEAMLQVLNQRFEVYIAFQNVQATNKNGNSNVITDMEFFAQSYAMFVKQAELADKGAVLLNTTTTITSLANFISSLQNK